MPPRPATSKKPSVAPPTQKDAVARIRRRVAATTKALRHSTQDLEGVLASRR